MKRVSQAIIAVLSLAAAGSAFAAYDSYFDYARVVEVDKTVQTNAEQPVTRQECWNEPRDEFHPSSAAYRSEVPYPVTDGEDRVIRTVDNSSGYYTRTYEQHCRTHTDYAPAQQVAFDVVYRYNGEDYRDRMNHQPGSRVRVHVENGYVELAE